VVRCGMGNKTARKGREMGLTIRGDWNVECKGSMKRLEEKMGGEERGVTNEDWEINDETASILRRGTGQLIIIWAELKEFWNFLKNLEWGSQT